MPQPSLFIGHGSPMNIVSENDYTRSLHELSLKLNQNPPDAILVVSAHWLTKGTYITYTDTVLETVYDFGGFPEALYKIKYQAKGSIELAEKIIHAFNPYEIKTEQNRGLDHGAWGVLYHLFPKTDIPVIQMSIDATKNAAQTFLFAKNLTKLRDQNILIIGSGNIIHSFEYMHPDPNSPARFWANEFQNSVIENLQNKDFENLINFQSLPDFDKAINSGEHYFPFIYTIGAVKSIEKTDVIFDQIQHGSMSMLSVKFYT